MQRRKYGLLVALSVFTMLWGIGCHKNEGGNVMTEDQVTGESKTAPFKTSDGWSIVGDYYAPDGKPKGVVILLHQRNGSADDWHPLCIALKQAGYLAFPMDARGTGRSTQGPGQTGEQAPWDTTGDIEAAVNGLKDKGPVTLIGASYGANNALLFAAAQPTLIRSVVLFSPSTDYHDLKTTDAVKQYPGPLLIFHQKGDEIAGDGPAKLDSMSGSKDHKLIVNDGTGHGTALLNTTTTQQTVDFLRRTSP